MTTTTVLTASVTHKNPGFRVEDDNYYANIQWGTIEGDQVDVIFENYAHPELEYSLVEMNQNGKLVYRAKDRGEELDHWLDSIVLDTDQSVEVSIHLSKYAFVESEYKAV